MGGSFQRGLIASLFHVPEVTGFSEFFEGSVVLLIGYFDGASRGNPGEAGAGACLVDDVGSLVWESHRYLGKKTNNEAEYQALIDLLEEVNLRGILELEIRGDSQLVLSQVEKKWKINKEHLRLLAEQVWERAASIKVKWVWVPREQNKLADALSNIAIDSKDEATAQRDVPPPDAGASVCRSGDVDQRLSAVVCVLGGQSLQHVADREGIPTSLLEEWVSKGKAALLQALCEGE